MSTVSGGGGRLTLTRHCVDMLARRSDDGPELCNLLVTLQVC